MIYLDASNLRRIATSGLQRSSTTYPRAIRNLNGNGINGPAPPHYNSVQIKFVQGEPSDAFQYNYVSPDDNSGVAFWDSVVLGDGTLTGGRTYGVAFNYWFRNSPRWSFVAV